MMKAKAAYEYDFDNDVLFITDLSDLKPLSMTVTNDIENVLHDIAAFEKRQSVDFHLSNFKIMYRDSDGTIDGVEVDNDGRFVAFFSICQFLYEKAKYCLLMWHKNKSGNNG